MPLYYEATKQHAPPTGPHADYVALLEARLKGKSRAQIAGAVVIVLIIGWLGFKELSGIRLPSPNPDRSPVAVTAREYIRAAPSALRTAAKDVRSGQITDHNVAVKEVARIRETATKAWNDAFDAATREHVETSGKDTAKIIDANATAKLYEHAADAMEGAFK